MTMLMIERPRPRPAEVLGSHGSVIATLRVPEERGGMTSPHEVRVVAREVSIDTCAVYVDDARVGWIRRDGHYYLALAGDPAHMRECGHALLWDEAARMLLAAA
jgi:hypothetical protein